MSGVPPLSESMESEPGFDVMPRQTCRTLLVFQFSDRCAAFHLEDIERVIPMAELAAPPGLPSVLEGILNLKGVAVPVLRLDRLFGLPGQRPGLYSTLVVLRYAGSEGSIAVLVDRVSGVITVPQSEFMPVEDRDSLNGCAAATVMGKDGIIHLLSSNRLLLAKEQKALSDLRTMAQQRLRDWQMSQP